MLGFEFEVKDTQKVYNQILEVDHTKSYGFQNMYVKTKTIFPSGKETEQVLSLELANRIGFWLGACDKEECELEIPIQNRIYFPEKGTYQFILEPYMRVDPLPGIRQIALKIEETELSR